MLKHKIGDVVRVRSFKSLIKEFNTAGKKIGPYEDIKLTDYYFTYEMRKYCGKLVTIRAIDKNNNAYFIKDDKVKFCWIDEMFDDYKNNINEDKKINEDKGINKITQVMNIIGIKKDEPINIYFPYGQKSFLSPHTFDGNHLIDREGNEDDKYIGNIITGKYTFNTAAKPPTKSTLNNTNVYVRNKINDPWKPAHFVCMSGCINWPYTVYGHGMSAFTANGYTENFKYAKLAE